MSKENQKRRHYSSTQKAAILRRHLVDKVPISDLCEEFKIQPSVFYGWQQQLFGNMELALDAGKKNRKQQVHEWRLEKEIQGLRARLAKKDGVIAEISEEFVALKKELGEP